MSNDPRSIPRPVGPFHPPDPGSKPFAPVPPVAPWTPYRAPVTPPMPTPKSDPRILPR